MTLDLPIEFEFDHVGIAVPSIEEGRKFYEALGMKVTHIEKVESQQVQVAMLKLNNSSQLELLESTHSEGPIAKFIAKKGPGIHHICIRVKDIESRLSELKQKGFQLIHDEPFQGAHNCRVAFVHPKATGGVLLELSEPQG